MPSEHASEYEFNAFRAQAMAAISALESRIARLETNASGPPSFVRCNRARQIAESECERLRERVAMLERVCQPFLCDRCGSPVRMTCVQCGESYTTTPEATAAERIRDLEREVARLKLEAER